MPLPIAEADAAGALLLDAASGQPVWPLAGAQERAALEALCGVFGAEPTPVATRAGEPPARAGGTVVGIGDVAAEARLHAHLSGRDWRLVEDAAALRRSPLPDVVLSLSPRIDATLVATLATAPPAERTTGIVWGRTRAELRTQVLLRAAAAFLAPPPDWLFTGVVGYASLERVEQGEVEWLGGGAEPAALRGAVSRGAALLAILAHGDPLGFRLADEVVVCGVPRLTAADADPAGAPLCHATRVCHKLHAPFEQTTASERFLDPDVLAARVLALVCCQGASVGSPVLDPRWGVLPQLLANPRIGALLATPDLSTFALGEVGDQLCKPLTAGVPVGEALASYERHPAVAKIGHRLLLFGDPGTRVGPPRTPPPLTPGGEAPRTRRAELAHDVEAAELELLRTVAHYVREDTRAQGEPTSARAAAAVERQAREPSAAGAQAMRSALLDHVTTIRGRPEDAWMLLLNELKRAREHEPCPNCAWPVRPARTRLACGLLRTLVHCPRCANVVDRPYEATLALHAALPQLRLDGPLPARDWAGAVYLAGEDPCLTESQPWPAAPDGAPARTCVVSPPGGPPRPLAVRVVLIAGTTVHAFGVPGRDRDRTVRGA